MTSKKSQNFSQHSDFTQSVLELLKAKKKPLSAYDLLDQLKQPHKKLAPTTIYRSLKKLLNEGLVHKIAGKNTYIACKHVQKNATATKPKQTNPHLAHFPLIAYCEKCGNVDEGDVPGSLNTLPAHETRS